MNVGDRVRLLTGTEQGIITRLLDSELVEVAIDNDFTIPVLRREVVVIAAEEGQSFESVPSAYKPGKANQNPGRNPSKKDKSAPQPVAKAAPQPSLAEALAAVASSGPAAAKAAGTQSPKSTVPQVPAAAKGVFLALVHQSPELLGVTLINNTDSEVLFTYGEETASRPYRALAADKLGPKASTKPLTFLHMKDFDAWPASVVQLLPFRINGDAAYELLLKRQAFKASTFYGSKREAPVIKQEAYLFQLDERAAQAIAPEKLVQEAPAPASTPAQEEGKVDVQALKAQLSGDAPAKPAAIVAAAAPAPAGPVVAPPHEFDLHLEALRPDAPADLSNTAILRLQLDAFEDALSRALATNMHEIIFIHGMGNGVLRKEMHRQLSRNKDIKFFEDAKKEKFGFGATLVRLK
jgi:hypothetical protein